MKIFQYFDSIHDLQNVQESKLSIVVNSCNNLSNLSIALGNNLLRLVFISKLGVMLWKNDIVLKVWGLLKSWLYFRNFSILPDFYVSIEISNKSGLAAFIGSLARVENGVKVKNLARKIYCKKFVAENLAF